MLDLSQTPVEITSPGVYVLDRNWGTGSDPGSSGANAIVITAADVTLDLQGFELRSERTAIRSTGRNATIRNGRLLASQGLPGIAISASGDGTLIDGVRARTGGAIVIEISGVGSVLQNSYVNIDTGGAGVQAGDDSTLRDNRISSSEFISIIAASRTTIVDNDVWCGQQAPCIEVRGTNNIVSRNKVTETRNLSDGLVIRGDFNQAMENVFIADCESNRTTAIVVEGRGNTIRDNLVPSCGGGLHGGPGYGSIATATSTATTRYGLSYRSASAPLCRRTWAATLVLRIRTSA